MSTPRAVVLVANQLGPVLRGARHEAVQWSDRYLGPIADQLTTAELTDAAREAAVQNAERTSLSGATA
jgi:hypothetical protein